MLNDLIEKESIIRFMERKINHLWDGMESIVYSQGGDDLDKCKLMRQSEEYKALKELRDSWMTKRREAEKQLQDMIDKAFKHI